MHFIVIRFIQGVYYFLLWTFSDAACSKRTRPTVSAARPVFFGQVPIVAFYLLGLNLLVLWTGVIVSFFVIGESFALMFVFSEVRDVAGDVVFL